MLELSDVFAGYSKEDVLKEVSLTAEKGEFTVIIGKNGSGKSTLLKSVVGILDYRGKIKVSGNDISKASDIQRARRVSYLPQVRNAPNMSVKSLLLHGRFPHLSYPRRYGKKDIEIVEKAMGILDISEFSESLVSELSGGQQRKAYIAMALSQETPVILMDEPTTYLDAAEQLKLLEVIKKLAAEGKTIVAVMHDIALALKYADKIAVMDEGRILYCGKIEELTDSGIIEKVYGVKLKKADLPQGTEYFISL